MYSLAGDLAYVDRLNFTKVPDESLTIGDYANFTITAEYWGYELYKNVTIVDNLPNNFVFVSANPNPDSTVNYDGGKRLIWELGDFNGPKTVKINLVTIVNDTAENQNGFKAVNEAYSTFTNESGQTFKMKDNATITIVEPNLAISKSVNKTVVEYGDIVKYTIKVYHKDSTHDAYDVWINDTIPNGLELLNHSVSPTPNQDLSSGNEIKIYYSEIQQSVDSSNPIVVTYTCRVEGVLLNETLENNATVTWTSTAGDNPYERYGGWNDLDDYNRVSKAEITARSEFGIEKSVDKNEATIGESLNYTVKVNLPRVLVKDVWINDTLPEGVIYDNNLWVVANNDDLKEIVNGRNVSVYLGNVNNTDGKNITLEFRAIVNNESTVRNGDVLTNKVVFACKDANNNTITLQAKAQTEVIEPDLVLEKFARDYALVDDVVEYTLKLYHSAQSKSDAYDVVLLDKFPKNTVYIPNSAEIVSGDGNLDVTDGTLSATFDKINLSWNSSNPIILKYKLRMLLSPTRDWTNYANLTWSSLPGEQVHERNYFKQAEHTVKDAMLNLTKIDNPDPVVSGKLLTYKIIVKNEGNYNLTNITVKEYYDQNVTFVSADKPSVNNDTWSIPLLKPGESYIINITVRVGKIENGTILFNRVNLTSDQVSDEVWQNTTVLSPLLEIEKFDFPDPVLAGSLLNYTIIVKNNGIVNATNITVKEYYDQNVTFVNANPMPSINNDTWEFDLLKPGESYTINVTVRVRNVSHGTVLKNVCSAESDETNIIYAYQNTTVVKLPILEIKKTGPKVVEPGGVVTYEIEYCVELGKAHGVKIVEYYPPRTQFINATPPPTRGNNVWELGDLEPGHCGKIVINLRVMPYEYNFSLSESIKGRGLVIANKDVYTGQEEYYITNRVKMTAEPEIVGGKMYYIEPATASFTTKVKKEAGTRLKLHEHGSGDYYTNEDIFAIKKKDTHRIDLSKEVLSKLREVNTTVFDFNVSVPWKIDVCLINYIRNESIHQSVESASLVNEILNGSVNDKETSLAYNQSVYGWSKLKVKSKYANVEEIYVGKSNISEIVGFK